MASRAGDFVLFLKDKLHQELAKGGRRADSGAPRSLHYWPGALLVASSPLCSLKLMWE